MSVAHMTLAVLAASAGFPAKIYSIAATASERLLFSLGVGTLLAVAVWLLLRVFRNKDSRTSFAVWFATLMITAALPVASLYLSSAARAGGRSSGAVVTVSANWASASSGCAVAGAEIAERSAGAGLRTVGT